MFGLTQEQLMGIGGLLGGAGQGISQGGWRGAFGGAQQGLLNAQQMMQAQEMMKLRKAAAAMQEQEFAQKQQEVARQSQMRNTAEMQLTGDIGAGMLGDIPRAPGMPPPGGLLGQVGASPAMRAYALSNPMEGLKTFASSEMATEAERRKLLAGRDEKVWENENLKIPAEQRAAAQAAAQARLQNDLSTSREEKLIPLRAATQADNRKPITLRMQDGAMRSFMPGDPQVRAALDAGAVPVNLSVQSPTIEGMGIGKTGQNALDEGLIKAADGLARIGQIRQSFKPEFQTIETRLGVQWTALKDKANIPGWQPTPEQKSLLGEYTAYARDAWENANSTIQAITGAAMTNAETPRLMRQMPNPGTGLLDGDSPTEFQSKLAGVEKSLRQVFARYSYAKAKGLNWQSIPLDNVPKLMAEREKQLVATTKMKRPDLDADSPEFRDAVKRELATEFGLPVQ